MKSTILIEKYLDGTLKGNKLRDFIKQMKHNSELKELVILHKEANESIEQDDIIRFKNKLKKVYTLYRNTENNLEKDLTVISAPLKKKFNLQKRLLLIAATFTLVIIIGTLLYKSRDKVYTNNELFSMYYQPYIPDINIRSGDEKVNDLENAILLYDKGDYNSAFEKFMNIINKNNENYLAQFYLGLTCMELNKFDAAMQQFENILGNWESPFIYHSQWYLALCYLKNNNKEGAIALLMKIKSKNRYYKNKAEEILEKLN